MKPDGSAVPRPPPLYRAGVFCSRFGAVGLWVGLRLCAVSLAWKFRGMPPDVYGHALASAKALVEAGEARRGPGA